MIDVSRRVATVVVVLTLAAPVLADSIHPDLKQSEVISLNVAAIERDAQNGKPFDLALGRNTLSVVLTPEPLWPEEGLTILEIQRDGTATKQVVQGNITYAGEVEGEAPSVGEARFTITGGVLQGSVRTAAGWWFIEPLARFDPKADTSQYVVYEARDVGVEFDFGGDAVRTDVIHDPNPPFTCPTPDDRISVAMVSDREYINIQHPLNFWQRQTVLLNELSALYEAQFNKRFRLGMVIADSDNHVLRSSNAGLLLRELDDLVEPWLLGLQDLCSHIAHLTTGKDLEGNTYGRAWRPGWTGLTQQTTGTTDSLYYQNYMVMAHEIGHNFDAIHAEADEWCEPIPEDPFHCRWKRTLDWESFQVTHIPRFSDGTHGECKDNEQRMKALMASRHLWP